MWTKVVAPTILVSVLWIAVSAGTTFYISWLFESHSQMLQGDVATIEAGAGIQDVVWQLQAVAIRGLEGPDAELHREIASLEAAFQQHLAKAEQTTTSPEEKAIVGEIRQHFAEYSRQIEAGLPGNAPDPAHWRGRLETTTRLAHAVTQPCKRLLEVNEQSLAESTVWSERLGMAVIALRVAFLIAGPTIGILFGIYVARGLHRSISQISVTLKSATGGLEGDLGRVDIDTSGDLPGLEQQVQAVSAQIRKVVAELHEARREVIRAERLAAVGELAAGVAHEIRNPLTSVKLLIQTAAQRHPGQAMTDRQYRVVQGEITRMEQTIQGLLDFARPPQLHRVRHDVRDTLRRALNLMEGRAKQDRVSITTDLPERAVVVEADPEQLHQVFVNLLLNGIEAMPQGGLLSIAVEADGETAGACQVVFRDCGAGIPEEVMQRIFEPFITSKQRGTGLGLAVSRRIVEEHQGRLTAANATEGGAVFVVHLPLSLDGPTPPGGDTSGCADRMPEPEAASAEPHLESHHA